MTPAREVDCVAIWDSQSLDAPFRSGQPVQILGLMALARGHPPLC
jgi:hypothetical protein